MYRKLTVLACLMIYACFSIAQKTGYRGAANVSRSQDDTLVIQKLNAQCWQYRENDTWKAISFGLQGLELSQKVGFHQGEAQVLNYLGVCFFKMDDYNSASRYYFKALNLSEQHHIFLEKGYALNNIGNLLMLQGDCRQALNYSRKALQLHQMLKNKTGIAYAYVRMGESYKCLQMYDSLLFVARNAYSIRYELKDKEGALMAQRQVALAYEGMNKFDLALKYFTSVSSYYRNITNYYNDLARVHYKRKDYDQAIYYGLKSYKHKGFNDVKTMEYLSDAFVQKQNWNEAIYFLKMSNSFRDSISKQITNKHTKNLQILYETKEKERENTSLKMQLHTNKILFYFLAVFAIFGLGVAWFFSKMRTREKNSNILLSQKNEEISAQRDMLEELDNTKNKFFSIIAHDLRGPISNLNVFLTHIITQKEKLSAEHLSDYLLLIKDSTETTYKLLESLLTWARSQRGEITYNPSQIRLYDMVQPNIDLLMGAAVGKNVELKNEVDTGFRVVADFEMINTVVRNLLNNAIKYTKEGGRVWVGAHEVDAMLEISVSDTGVGMDSQYLDQLFRLDVKHRSKEGTRGEKGTGLGLILCREFVEMHGGHIIVESKPGKGSTFKFTLPLI